MRFGDSIKVAMDADAFMEQLAAEAQSVRLGHGAWRRRSGR